MSAERYGSIVLAELSGRVSDSDAFASLKSRSLGDQLSRNINLIFLDSPLFASQLAKGSQDGYQTYIMWSQKNLSALMLTRPDLYQLIKDEAPDAIKTGEIKNQFGRKVAIVRFQYHPSHTSKADAVIRMRESNSAHAICISTDKCSQLHVHILLPHRRPLRRPATHV